MSEERIDVTILGKTIGTASGWDEFSDFCLGFYDFKSSADHIPDADCLAVDLNTGVLSIENDGSVVEKTLVWSLPLV